jgi:phage/plasmid-associated DNA primase
MINAIVSGEPIIADTKYGKAKTFRNHAKLIFSCNNIPFDKSNNPALQKRLLRIEMNNAIPSEKQDLDLIKKLTTEHELSGLLNFALDGLQLLEKEGFPRQTNSKTESSQLHDFIKNKCRLGANLEVETEKLYNAYQKYVTAENQKKTGQGMPNLALLNPIAFGRELSAIGIEKSRVQADENRFYVYAGIALLALDFSYSLVESKKDEVLEKNQGNLGNVYYPTFPFLQNCHLTHENTESPTWKNWYETLLIARARVTLQ